MKRSDEDLVNTKSEDFKRALTAAAIALRSDRRFLGAPKMRERLEEICALQALGSNTSAGKAFFRDMSLDNINLYNDGLSVGVQAAKAALEKAVA